MRTISVFRLEHPVTGYGPWQSIRYDKFPKDCKLYNMIIKAANVLSEQWEKYPSHRAPWDDGLAMFDSSQLFGCTTLSTLQTWFNVSDQYIDALFDAGFTVVEYILPKKASSFDLSDSRRQAIFDPDEAIEKKDLGFLALFP